MAIWSVIVGGTEQAKERWPARTYKSKASAKRRLNEIASAHDPGVATVWIVKGR